MRPFKWWKEKSVAGTSSRLAADGTRSIVWLENGEPRGGRSRTAEVPQARDLTSVPRVSEALFSEACSGPLSCR